MSPSMTIKVVGHQWYTSPEFYPCDLDDQNLYSMAPRPLFLSIAKPKTKPVKDITSSTCTDIVAQGVTGSTVGIGSNA